MFARLMANKGLNSILGLRRLGAVGRQIGAGARSAYGGAMGAGKMYQAGMRGPAIGYGFESGMRQLGRGLRQGGRWATATGRTTGRFGAAAARMGAVGGGVMAGGAALDFMNPWGLGWGD